MTTTQIHDQMKFELSERDYYQWAKNARGPLEDEEFRAILKPLGLDLLLTLSGGQKLTYDQIRKAHDLGYRRGSYDRELAL